MDERRVPVYVPVWEDANRVRPWATRGDSVTP